jgi:hypothetical protein
MLLTSRLTNPGLKRLGKLGIPMQMNEVGYLPYAIYKNQLKID